MPDGVKTRLAGYAPMAKQRLDGMVIGRKICFRVKRCRRVTNGLPIFPALLVQLACPLYADAAVLFSDGRYSLQMLAQTDPADWHCYTCRKMG